MVHGYEIVLNGANDDDKGFLVVVVAAAADDDDTDKYLTSIGRRPKSILRRYGSSTVMFITVATLFTTTFNLAGGKSNCIIFSQFLASQDTLEVMIVTRDGHAPKFADAH